ncbi:MAG: transglutaminase domain-containing protein [Oscillospiraceae bacterium]|nr:transglutaminase domain-containing protein [Oscillospiraceae bacterium]
MKKESSIKINILQKEKNATELLPEALAVFAAAGGFSAMLMKAFSVGISPAFGLLIGVAAAVCVFFSGKKTGKFAPLAVSAICIAAAFAISVLRNGLLVLGNNLLEFLIAATGRIYLPFEVSGESLPAGSLLFLLVAICVLIKNPVVLAFAGTLTAAGLLIGFLSTDFWFLLFLFGIAGIIFNVFLPFFGRKTTAKSVVSVFAVPAACVLICAVLINFVPAGFGENVRSFAKKTAHSFVFDSKTNAMPEGNFENLGAFDKNDAPALEITMEKPQKLYLKGFAGEVYNGMGWEEIENENLAEYAEDFYILHRNGFFGQSSVSSALEATGKQEYSAMSITNLSACSKRVYLPYAVSNAGFNNLEIGDVNTNSFGKSYEISYISGGLSEWYKAQVELSEKQGADAMIDEHLANEQLYREFVKANYLGITEEAYAAIDRIFADSKAATATEIISEILVYLEKGVTYDEDFSSNGGTDFAAFFLEKSARGYSVHYATAATLMFRYFGIPARYAEGYFLSAEEAAEFEHGETIILTENHAHAWAEYYLEGVGWIPFEVTPGYMDDELEKAAFNTNGESSKRYEQSELPETNVEQDRPKDNITEAEKDYTALIAVSVSVFVLAIIAAAVYVIVMRKRLKKALSAIDNADNKTGAAMRFGYAQKLSENAELTAETLEICGYSAAFEINREALFSKHPITDEQRKTVDVYAEKILAKCKNKWSLWQKFKNRFVKFIY